MRIAVFNTKDYDRSHLQHANETHQHEMTFFEPRLTLETAELAARHQGVCAFVNDVLDAAVLGKLARGDTRYIALRSAGFNNVDLTAATELGLKVARVPAYSPHAVAEHTVALMLCLNRKIHRAYARVREANFSLSGLLGFDIHQKTVGIVGTGKIGTCLAHILRGFGCQILAFDPQPNQTCRDLGVNYVDLQELWKKSHIISLHCPLTPETHYLVDADAIATMRDDVMLVNVSRGAVIDTKAVIQALKHRTIGSLGIDVYEEESEYFFEDRSAEVLEDDQLARLLTFPNVLITGHQGFFTEEALAAIASTTLKNFTDFQKQGSSPNEVPT